MNLCNECGYHCGLKRGTMCEVKAALCMAFTKQNIPRNLIHKIPITLTRFIK